MSGAPPAEAATTPAVAVSTLTHLAFNAPDLDRTIAFYQKYAGLRLVHDRMDGNTRVAWLSPTGARPTCVLVFIQGEANQAAAPPAMDHLGFVCETREAVDAVAAQAEADGVPVVQGPVDFPPPVGYFVIIADPDGNRVEFSHGQPTDLSQG